MTRSEHPSRRFRRASSTSFRPSIVSEPGTFRRVMETGEPAETEQYLPEPFGYWVEIRMFADDDGLSVYSREITERKETSNSLGVSPSQSR